MSELMKRVTEKVESLKQNFSDIKPVFFRLANDENRSSFEHLLTDKPLVL